MGLLTSASGKGRTNNPAAAVAASPYGMGVPQYGAMPYSAFDDDSI
jgi:hypothetical protein